MEHNLAENTIAQRVKNLTNAPQDFMDDIEGRFGEIPEDCDAYHHAR